MIDALIAALPILAILILMLIFKRSAAQAGLTGLILALILAWTVFGYGEGERTEIGVAAATGGALAEAVFTALTILWIIIPALCIHHLQLRTGAIEVLRQSLGNLSADPRITVILVAWFFALFIEGAAGFGTTIALAAPFLVSVGFRPVEAVTLVLIGHSVGVSFGAVGTPIVPQVETTGLSGMELAQVTGLYHTLLGWVMLFMVIVIATRSLPDQTTQSRTVWGWTLLAAVLFLLPFFLISRFVGPELPTLGGALLGGVAFVAILGRVHGYHPPKRTAVSQTDIPPMSLPSAAMPYLALIVLVLVSRLIPPVQQAFYDVVWQWSLWGDFGGSFRPLYQPGTLLVAAFLFSALWQRASRGQISGAILQAVRQVAPVTIALVAMLGLSRIMVHAGMIDRLAQAAADLAGAAWPLFAPLVGVLGTFVTGSATASNILFTDFQQATALNLGLPVLFIVAAQGFGAAIGNIICPHNIIAGCATVGLAGQEGPVLRKTLLACMIYVLLGGVLLLWLV